MTNDDTMTKKVEHIAPPTSSDANSASYPVKRAPNGIGRYVEISTDMAICDYWMNILGTALAEKRKIKADGKPSYFSLMASALSTINTNVGR